MATLSQLLEHPGLGLRLVQSGSGDPTLSWVSTTELLDLGDYLEGGEIVLTTGLGLGAEDARWLDFVASLSRARVAAIGFGVGVTHEHIPAPLVAAASAYRVALLEVPPPVPFIAVSKAVAGLLQADELRAAHRALLAQQQILDGARGPQDTAEVLASIAQATGRHLALVASDGTTLASTAGFGSANESGGAQFIALDPESSLQLAVAGDSALGPEGHAVITAGSMVLGLGLRSDREDEARERDRWERLTASMLRGDGSAAAVAILAPGLELPPRMRAILVQGRAEDTAAWRRRQRSGLDRLIASAPEGPAPPGLALAWQLCSDQPEAIDRSLADAARHDLDTVVGRPARLAEIPLSRRSATARLRSLSPTAPLYTAPRVPQTVWADRDTPLLEALLGLGAGAPRAAGDETDETAQIGLSARVLGPLSRHDADAPREELSALDRELLRRTLRAVFEADGQRGPAAAALGVHRNTLRDRILRIERLTKRSLADADDRAELWIALRLEQLSSG